MRPFDWRPHLEKGEALIWQGRPYPAIGLIRPTQAEMLIGVLGVLAVAALIIADRSLPSPADGSIRPMVFLGLLLIALLVTGVPFRAMHQRSRSLRRTAYALTDRRMMIGNTRRPGDVETHRLPRRAAPVIDPEPHGLSTLHFGPGTLSFRHLNNADAVANVARVAR